MDGMSSIRPGATDLQLRTKCMNEKYMSPNFINDTFSHRSWQMPIHRFILNAFLNLGETMCTEGNDKTEQQIRSYYRIFVDKISGKNLLSRWPFRKWKGNNTEKTKKVTEVLRGRARTIYPNGDHCRKFDVNPVKGSKVLSGHFICAVHENQLRSSSLFFGTMIGTGIYRSWFLSTEAISWNWAEKNISLYFFWPFTLWPQCI